jgi:hypothetical protein
LVSFGLRQPANFEIHVGLAHLKDKAPIVDPDFGVVWQRLKPRDDLTFRPNTA